MYRDSFKDLVVQSNQLTSAAYSYSTVEKKLFYILANHIHNLSIDDIKEGKNLIIQIDASPLMNIDSNISRVCQILGDMRKKNIEIKNNDKWISVGVINYVEYNKLTHIVEIEVSHKILPFLWSFTKEFTIYSLNVALSFDSIYTMRLYEICHQWKKGKHFKLSIEEIKKMFLLEKKYEKTGDLIIKTIKVAQRELLASFERDLSEIYFTYEEDKSTKEGRKINHLIISVHSQSDSNQSYDIVDILYFINSKLQYIFPKNKRYTSRVASACFENQAYASDLYGKILEKEQYYSKEALPLVLRKVFKDDFNIL